MSNSKPAVEKLIKFLSVRDHSENELSTKLARYFSSAEIQDALKFARKNKLMKTPSELAEQVYEELSRKDKGYLYIEKYLEQKGLPHQAMNEVQELEKALKVVAEKLKITGKPNDEEKIKIFRLLSNRGFDDQTIRTVAHEES